MPGTSPEVAEVAEARSKCFLSVLYNLSGVSSVTWELLLKDPMQAPDGPTRFTVQTDEGIPIKLEVGDKVITGALGIFKAANDHL
ncbi:hypothetical protein MKX08_001436 [Trichoderma sp. CBMAI-0020]|nr:hypothetical protein MKX08_001436 [Trichoderma sp. CBMAI-0020]